MKNRKNSIKGFTLIEMIVVIALIGILMGVAFPQTTKFLAAGRDTKRISDVSRVVPGYLELYFNQEGEYPEGDWAGLAAKLGPSPGANVLGGKGLPKATGVYIYVYCPGDNNYSYTLGVKLETDNKALDESVGNETDVSCGGLTCGKDEHVYCVQP